MKRDGVRLLNGRFQKALILENPDPVLDETLQAMGIECDRLDETATLDRSHVLQRLRSGQHDLIFKRSRFQVDKEVLAASENLAAVMLCCIGDDSVDKQACADEGVLVINDPVSNGRSVVELVFGQMVGLARRVFHAAEETRNHRWTKNNLERYELMGKTLAVIGLGNIGKAVARMADAWQMNVCFFDDRVLAREVGAALGWRPMPTMLEAFEEADFVTMHVSAESAEGVSNRYLVTPDHFAALGRKRDAGSPRIFINASRGFLYSSEDLIQAVASEHVRHAAVDVFSEEPGSGSDEWVNPFAGYPRIVATPHIGASTQEAQPRIATHIAGTTKLLNQSGTVRDCVFSPGVRIGVAIARPSHILAVIHSDARGTKKAVSDCIFNAGANNLESSHRDFPKYGFAYELSGIDTAMTEDDLRSLVGEARSLSGDSSAIRSVRLITLS